MHHAEFRDPRLVPVYDAAFRWGRDDDFFLCVVNERPGSRVLDLGCGTGRLTLAMAAAGHTVTGVDPARASLDAARAKQGAERVTWIEGTSSVLPSAAFDTAVMTSHVAQLLVDDAEWRMMLADVSRALVPDGRLVFDSRDPRARGWERWNRADSLREVTLPDGTSVQLWAQVTAVGDSVVSASMHYNFATGEHLKSTIMLRFRSEEELRLSLQNAGLEVEQIYGGWNREPVGAEDGELLVVARSVQT